MKTIVLVYSGKGLTRAIKTAEKTDSEIISLTPETDMLLSLRGVMFKSVSDYRIKAVPYEDIYLKRLKLFNEWGKVKINEDSLSKNLIMEGIDTWDCIENEAGEANLEFIIFYADIIQRIVDEEKPTSVTIFQLTNIYFVPRDKVFFPPLIESICRKHKIKLTLIGKASKIKQVMQKPVDYLISLMKRYRQGQRKKLKNYNPGEKKVLFFLYGGGMDKTSHVQKALVEKGISAMTICSAGIMRDPCSDYFEKRNMEYAYSESFIDSEIIKKTSRLNSKLNEIWKLMIRNRRAFTYDGIELFPAFSHQLEYFFRIRLPELITFILTLDKITGEMKPSLIINMNDSVFYGRAVVSHAKLRKIPTLLMQHANQIDISCRIEPRSDFIASWHSINPSTLKKKEDISRFHVTGTTKQNTLVDDMKRCNKDMIRQKLGIDKSKKIVLFAARFPISRDFLRIKDFENILKEKENVVGIVKIHPADTISSQKELSWVFRSKNLIIIRDIDFVSVLSISDFVISTDECTTSTDSIMVNKPLIIIDYEKGFDQIMTDLADKKITIPCLRATKEPELKEYIDKLLYDDKAVKNIIDLEKDYNNKNNSYNKDSEKRIVNVIEKIIAQRKITKQMKNV
jgi:hypothetical protein